MAQERGPVATAREREPVAQHGANARASGSLGANAPGLWPMRYVNTYPWHMAHGAWRMAHGTSHVWVKTAGRPNESTARSWRVPKKGGNPPRSGRRSVLQSGRPFPCGLSHQAEQAHDGAWRMAHGTWHMAHSAWRTNRRDGHRRARPAAAAISRSTRRPQRPKSTRRPPPCAPCCCCHQPQHTPPSAAQIDATATAVRALLLLPSAAAHAALSGPNRRDGHRRARPAAGAPMLASTESRHAGSAYTYGG